MRRLREVAFVDLLGWLLGISAVLALPLPGNWSWTILLAVIAAISLAACGPTRGRSALAAAGVVLLGFGLGTVRVEHLAADPLAGQIGDNLDGAIVVVGEAWRGTGYARIATGAVLGPAGGPVLLRVSAGAPPERGSLLRVVGALARPRGPEGGFDERAWLNHQGIHAVLRVRSLEIIGRRGGLWGLSDRLRHSALAALVPAGRDDTGQVLAGLAFGADAGLTPATIEAFRASGLAHLLAVSGGNVALLVALLVLAVWVMGGSRRLALGLSIGAIVVYVTVVGPSPSVVRAGIAGVVGCLAWLLGRPRDAWRALALGFGALMLWNPWAVLDPGLQLSFVAVAAILLVVPYARRISEATAVPYVLAAAVLVTAAATLATAPIAWWHFGRASIIASLPANLAAAPAVPLALWAALLATVVTPLAPAAGAGIAWCAQWPAAWILQCARGGAWLAAVLPAWLTPLAIALPVGLLARRMPRAVRRVGWRRVRRQTALSGLPHERHGSRQDSPGA